MDWTKVRNEYPVSWDEFVLWYMTRLGYIKGREGAFRKSSGRKVLQRNTLFGIGDLGQDDVRDLFDFFDSRGIECFYGALKLPTILTKEQKLHYTLKGWVSEKVLESFPKIINIRAEAESLMFEKSFEIYESYRETSVG